MKVLGGLLFVLAALVGTGFSLTCYTYNEETGGVEDECEVADPQLQQATAIDNIERLCYTFQSIQGSGKNRKVKITRGCSSDNKIDTCEKLKETLLIGKQAKIALTNCSACYSNYCNYDPNWTEHDSPSGRQERQWSAKRTTPTRLVPNTPTTKPAPPTTPKVDLETEEPALRTDEPEQNQGSKEEIGARQGKQVVWGQGGGRPTTRNPYNPNAKDNSQEEEEGRGQGSFGSGINGQARPGPGWTNNGQYGGNNGQAKPGPGLNNGQNGNGFGSGINGQARPGPGWTNNGQNGGINGQAKPGPGLNNGQNGDTFGSGINGQARPGPGWTNNGQHGGINGQAKPGPGLNNGQNGNGFGSGINGQARPGPGWTNNGQFGGSNSPVTPGFGEETDEPFEGENVAGNKVGQNPDGTWKTGVQYVSKYPGERATTRSPHQPGAKPFPTPRPGGTGEYHTKDKNGPPLKASADHVRYVTIFVVSSVFVLLAL